ncbi:uncharacterized protein LOC124662256 [Lolium rigidum]|uniref:uncharacterized protein LOC124662256 n=1 Tax=Lolium rigidum TaxID=89674 RepID=UPI001F5CA222|nr:uncharacterized protein LOC124662256 [Lolium rigidum]
MAAAPAEDPTPSATPDLPLAKKKKRAPSYLETSPVTLATAAAGWSSLPDDLVRRIADSFLATNDLDHYMCLRAVCPSWRAATDDPKSKNNTFDTRFYPRTWIILDEQVFQCDDDHELLLLNVATGRFLRKKLPLLREYYIVATTPSGFFVLADRSPPHAARLFNPLTGVLTRFVAPVPPDATVANVASLAIILLADSSRKVYTAVPHSEGFNARDYQQGLYNFFRKAVVGGAYSHVYGAAFGHVVAKLFDLLTMVYVDPVKCFSSDYLGDANDVRCFVVGLPAHMLLVMIICGSPSVVKVNTETGSIGPMHNISRFAIFIGHRRCLAVDTNRFPGIEANCLYSTQHLGSSARICKYNLKDCKEEVISEAAEFTNQDKQFILVTDRPFTIIHLLCSYTINILDSQLAALQQMA